MRRATIERSVLRVTVFVLGVLTIPLVGAVFSDEIAWTLGDFAVAGVLLAVAGSSFEVAARRRGSVLLGAAVASVGIVCGGLGAIDDVPGLLVLGALLALAGGAIAYRQIEPAH